MNPKLGVSDIDSEIRFAGQVHSFDLPFRMMQVMMRLPRASPD